MDTEFEKTVFERLAKLPEATQAAIRDTNLSIKFQEIARANSLHIDQAAELEEETLLLILEFSSAEQFVERLSNALHVTKEQAAKIQTEVNEKIFLPIRGHMQTASAPTPTPPTPHPADKILTQKTISVAPSPQIPPKTPPATPSTTSSVPTTAAPLPPSAPQLDPAAPQPYKADPYREPIQ